jgi:predicted CopG family antitoxin
MSEYKNIKVTPPVFEDLQRGKDDGQSWSHYLKELREKEQQLDEIENRR